MAFHKLEDTSPQPMPPKVFREKTGGGWVAPVTVSLVPSSSTVGHTTWRCGTCRALAVGPLGCEPPPTCGKCGSVGGAA